MLQVVNKSSIIKNLKLFIVIFCSVCLFIQPVFAKYSGGNGISMDPYRIRTISDWQTLINTPSDWNMHFIITADIDLNNVSIKPVGDPFPMASFFGTLDGNGHIISNANINTPNIDNVGLIGNLGLNGKIRNLELSNITINGHNNVGGLVGYNWGGEIINCNSSGQINGNMSAGGLVGENSEGTIAQSDSSCTVDCTYNAGGLVGFNNNGSITQCYSTGEISGNLSTGGLVGDNSTGSITQSYSTGKVNGKYNSGGLAGYNNGSITQCNSSSEVTGEDYVGAIVGYNWDGVLSQSYSTGSASGNYDVGALLGYNFGGTIAKCYSTGTAAGTVSVGGLVGENSSGIIAECYSKSTVDGSHFSGGLVGNNNDIIILSYSTSTITGDLSVGGLAGLNTGDINDCYSTGNVNGLENHIGGLVGENEGNLIRCYSASPVSGKFETGGLVGSGMGNVVCSIWDMETSGLSGSSGGVGLTTNQMMGENMLGLNGFASDPNWILDAGNDYPRLAWEGTPGDFISQPNIDWITGTGIEADPYQIETAEQLVLTGKANILSDKYFVLNSDIILDSNFVNTEYADPNIENELIFGQAIIPTFSGFFEGNNHKISNMIINGDSFLGLFGRLEPKAEITNLSIENSEITGSGKYIGGLNGYNNGGTVTFCNSQCTINGCISVGGLVGNNTEGIISQCYSTSIIDANLSVGGLVGENIKGNISQCYSTGQITGNADIGGLVGYNWDSSLTQSYSDSIVAGSIYVGGLAGENIKSNIEHCYSTGIVSGNFEIGGLIGNNYDTSIIIQSFWDIKTSGKITSAAGTGKTTSQMKAQSTFTSEGWDFADESTNGIDDIWWIQDGQSYPKLWWETLSEN